MLLVIFGAGASYDSFPSEPPPSPLHSHRRTSRLPLTNELFQNRFDEILLQPIYRVCRPIIPYLKKNLSGDSIEEILGRLHDEGRDDPERIRQLAGIRFYLQEMITKYQEAWEESGRGISNYNTFIDQIRHHQRTLGEVYLATFNYDTMLDHVLPLEEPISNIDDYVVDKNFKLIKLHGSVNWVRQVETSLKSVDNPPEMTIESNRDRIVRELIHRAPELTFGNSFHVVRDLNYESDEGDELDKKALYPAIAIPIQSKQYFECPQKHIDLLKARIPEIDKLILIGWSGKELRFLELLKENLRKSLRLMMVTGTKQGGEELRKRLEENGISGEVSTSVGFTHFVVNREVDRFLTH